MGRPKRAADGGPINHVLNRELRFLTSFLRPQAQIAALLFCCQVPCAAADRAPNVIVLIADDQGWGDLNLHGNANLATPHLDALAFEGFHFERFYVQPVCSPTRAEFLTGRYAPRDGVRGVTGGSERLASETATIGDAFRDAGYATAAFGKWHNGTQPPYHPCSRGFDHFYGFTSGHWGNYFNPMLDRDGTITKGNGYLPDDITNEAIRFIEQHRKDHFFALVAYNTPHSPMQVPDKWWRRHENQQLAQRGTKPNRENVKHTRAALAMVENIDWNVGRLLTKIAELDLTKDTIVVYFSDNGPNGHRFNGGLRGIKGSTDEGGVRSPLFIRWPGRIQAGQRIRESAAVIDLAPTLIELAGVDRKRGATQGSIPIDGISLVPVLLGQKDRLPPRSLFAHWGGRVSVRHGTLMLDNRGRLYDLDEDPGQTTDISAVRVGDAQRLGEEVVRWRRQMSIDRAPKQRPFSVGHPSLAMTQLPARDATTRGEIQRSNRFFNSTYFQNWTTLEDAIVWDVDVVRAGRYSVTLYYTCPEADVGSTVELRFQDASCRGTVANAHDPPLVGQESDRVPRQEGYVKHFRPLELGEITLPSSHGELLLQAISIPSSSVMEFRLLTLEWLE